MKLIDLDIVPGQITVSPGSQLVLNVTNAGGMRHDLAFPNGPATRMLDPGESQRLDLGTITTSRTVAGFARLVDEASLDRVPLGAIARGFGASKHRHRTVVAHVTIPIVIGHVALARHLASVEMSAFIDMRTIAIVGELLAFALVLLAATLIALVASDRLTRCGRRHLPCDLRVVSVVAHDALLTSLR